MDWDKKSSEYKFYDKIGDVSIRQARRRWGGTKKEEIERHVRMLRLT